MINDFILTYDNVFSKDECEDYIYRVNHYISTGIVFKEDYDKLHKPSILLSTWLEIFFKKFSVLVTA